MATARGNVILTDTLRFDVLGLVSIALPRGWFWYTDDINRSQHVGAIFRCYEDPPERDLGYMGVLDVTLDHEEPDISNCNESNVAAVDRNLERDIRRLMENDGRRFKRWMNSHLNHRDMGKALVTAYIAEDSGRDRQYIDARMRIGQRNVVVAGCFDVNRASELAAPIFAAMSDAVPLFRQ
jgi:hypothetical protein